MSVTPPRSAPSPLPPEEDADLFDYALLRDYAGFSLRAVRRNLVVATLAFLGVVGLGVAALAFFPKTYRVETTIQALRNPSLPSLANSGVYRPYEADLPTRAAKETVLRRDNLMSLVNQTDLVNKWLDHRAPAVRLLDGVRRVLAGHEPTKDERIDDLLDLLEKRLTVDVSEGTVTITLDWAHAQDAYELVETATQNFLETRHTTEIAMVSDAVAILEAHAANLQRRIGQAMGQLEVKERAARGRATPSPVRRPVVVERPSRATPQQSPEVSRLEAVLASKRRAISDLEDFRHRRLAELQSQLAQYQTMYADRHPAILSVRQNIEALSGPSPQLDTLRREAQDLEREIVQRGGTFVEAPVAAQRLVLGPDPIEPVLAPRSDSPDPRLEYERGQVRMLFSSYASVLERIDQARVEMDASQAAFKYRYSVLRPPQMPKRARSPKTTLVLAAAIAGGLLLGLVAAVLRDARSGRLLESWQVERQLGLPVLARIGP